MHIFQWPQLMKYHGYIIGFEANLRCPIIKYRCLRLKGAKLSREAEVSLRIFLSTQRLLTMAEPATSTTEQKER